MTGTQSVALSDQSYFAFISGLWTGDKGPLARAAVLRSTNFRGDGFLDYSDIAELQVRVDQLVARKLEPGDIVIERSGGGPKQPVGRVAIFVPPDDKSYATSNFTTALRVIDRTTFDPLFVNFFLHSLYLSGATESLQRATTGIRNLDWAEYQSFAVPKLPLNEQRSIAKLLSRAYDGAVVNDQQLEILAELKCAVMGALFTNGLRGEAQKDTEIGPVPESWELIPISALGQVVTGNTPPTKDASNYDSGTIPFVAPGDIEHGCRIQATAKHITEKGLSTVRPIPPGTTCFVCIGSTIGKVGYAPFTTCATNQQINSVIPSSHFDPQYVFYLMNHWADQVRKQASPSPVPILSKGAFEQIEIFTSKDKDEQREIAAVLDAIDRKIDLHKRKRAVLDELFKALLHKLMTGAIRVADLDLSALDAAQPEGAAA